jgi:hypothetical protein
MSCTFTAGANTTVYANFTSLAPPVRTHTLTVHVTGNGSIASLPAGINCPGVCAMAFAEGTNLALTATPAAGAAFTTWSGACNGAKDCSFALTADADVTATFASDPCAGLVTTPPAAKTQTATKADATGLTATPRPLTARAMSSSAATT